MTGTQSIYRINDTDYYIVEPARIGLAPTTTTIDGWAVYLIEGGICWLLDGFRDEQHARAWAARQAQQAREETA